MTSSPASGSGIAGLKGSSAVFSTLTLSSSTLLRIACFTTFCASLRCRTILRVFRYLIIIILGMLWPAFGASNRSIGEIGALWSSVWTLFRWTSRSFISCSRLVINGDLRRFWRRGGAKRLCRLFPMWAFPTSMKTEVLYGLSFNGGIEDPTTISRRDFVCAITHWLVGEM